MSELLPPYNENMCGKSTEKMPQEVKLSKNGEGGWENVANHPVRKDEV